MALLGRSYTKPIVLQGTTGVRIEPTPGSTVVINHVTTPTAGKVLQYVNPPEQQAAATTTTAAVVQVRHVEPLPPRTPVVLSAGPAYMLFSPALVIGALPQVDKKYKVFYVNQPTDTVVTPAASTPPALVIGAVPQIEKKYKVFYVKQPTDTPATTTTAAAVVVTQHPFPPKVKVWTWRSDPNAAPPEVGEGPPHICLPTFTSGAERDTGTGGTSRASGGGGSARVTGGGSAVRISGASVQTRSTGVSVSTRTTDVTGPPRTTTTEDGC